MQIINFATAHIEQAAQIASQNYEEERRHVPALPLVDKIPDLTPFAVNGLGVAAFDGDTMLISLRERAIKLLPSQEWRYMRAKHLSATYHNMYILQQVHIVCRSIAAKVCIRTFLTF